MTTMPEKTKTEEKTNPHREENPPTEEASPEDRSSATNAPTGSVPSRKVTLSLNATEFSLLEQVLGALAEAVEQPAKARPNAAALYLRLTIPELVLLPHLITKLRLARTERSSS
jgi:hypothetical protein